MKSDFSQNFIRQDEISIEIFAYDTVTGKYAAFVDKEIGYEHVCLLPKFKVSSKADVDTEIAKYLFSIGLIINSYKVLSDIKSYGFTFLNNNPEK